MYIFTKTIIKAEEVWTCFVLFWLIIIMGTPYPWPETLSSNKKRVIQELVEGQQCANQLQILFHNPSEEGSGHLSGSAEELVQKILRYFNETLSLLSSFDSAEVLQNQATSNDDSPCCDEWRSEDSSESRKRPASKNKRGCYKRNKAAQIWTVVSAKMEDGHAWRKYGQKEILNSKHPRSYFRCTRKNDEGCRAIKQVQRMEEDDSQMYRITYIGTHTCRDSYKAPHQIITDSESWESYNMVTSDDSKIRSKQKINHDLSPSTSPSPTKQESEEETTPSDDLTDLDSMVIWKDIMESGLEYSSSEPGMGCDMYSCTEVTPLNFELDSVIKPLELENTFHFDESELV